MQHMQRDDNGINTAASTHNAILDTMNNQTLFCHFYYVPSCDDSI
jgi:hypothetical protein